MLLNSEGKSDSVLFFAPMAIEAYQMLSPLNDDQRYDLGRIAEAAGALPLARAQADSDPCPQARPTCSAWSSPPASRRSRIDRQTEASESRLLAVYPSESAEKLPEYDRHAADIQSALTAARRR